MNKTSLEALFAPRSIAVVGASSDANKHGSRVVANLRRFGFLGSVFAVNPTLHAIEGAEVFPEIKVLPEIPDLVVIAVPAPAAVQVVGQAGEMGIAAALIFSGSFGEGGADGRAREDELKRMSVESGIRLLGPNTAGFINASGGVVASFLTCLEREPSQLRSGPVGLVSQSGGTLSFFHNSAAERGLGVALSVSTGNEADVEVAEIVQYMLEVEEIRAIGLHLETLRNGERFIAVAQTALERGIPIVACKVGQTTAGRLLMRSHTGAITSERHIYDAALEDLGIVEVDSPAELYEVTTVLSNSRPLRGQNVGVVTHSGGIAVLLADRLATAGVATPQPSEALADELASYVQLGALNNPIDLGSTLAGPERFPEAVRRAATDGAYDCVLAVSTPHPASHSRIRAQALAQVSHDLPIPVLNLWLAGDLGEPGLRILRASSVPVTTDVGSAVAALEGMGRIERALANLNSVRNSVRSSSQPRDSTVRSTVHLDEAETKHLLLNYGFAVPNGKLVGDLDEAYAFAEESGYPVVLKLVSHKIPHKSEVGGVVVNIRTPPELEAAWQAIHDAENQMGSETSGRLVEEFVAGPEALLGVIKDATFGPLVVAGVGGIYAELLSDVVVCIPPFTSAYALRKLQRLRNLKLFDGYRGTPPGDLSELARQYARLGDLAIDLADDLAELDLNPLIYDGTTWIVADAIASGSLEKRAG